jgi:heat shock protein HspQ
MEGTNYPFPQARQPLDAPRHSRARFAIGDVVRHKMFDFRGVVFDIDPVFANSEEWQNLLHDGESGPVDHPAIAQLFEDYAKGRYRLRRQLTH